MLFNLLAVLFDGETTTPPAENPSPAQQNPWLTWVILGVLVAFMVVWFVLSMRKRKKQEKEAKDLVDAVKPGNKVKTIGGICGIVVEVDNEENTFVMETGTELSGKSYLKFDRQAIYQTDAVVEKAEEKKKDKPEDITAPAEELAPEAVAEVPETTANEIITEQPAVDDAKSEEGKPDKKDKKNNKEKQIKF